MDRDEVFVEYTKSICPVCKVVVDAEINVRDGKVFLAKRCRRHGRFEALLYSDAELYFDSLRFNKPVSEVMRATVPMMVVFLIGVLLITYIPWMTTVLPSLLAH